MWRERAIELLETLIPASPPGHSAVGAPSQTINIYNIERIVIHVAEPDPPPSPRR